MKEIKKGCFYFISNEYIHRFHDPYLMLGHGTDHERPVYYSFKDISNNGILWIIPISHRVEKFRKIYNKKTRNNKPCDTIVFGDVLGQERVFLIQNMCPITDEYIIEPYKQNTTNNIVSIDGLKQKEINKKANKVLILQKKFEEQHRTNRLIFPDVFNIKRQLLKLDNEEKLYK